MGGPDMNQPQGKRITIPSLPTEATDTALYTAERLHQSSTDQAATFLSAILPNRLDSEVYKTFFSGEAWFPDNFIRLDKMVDALIQHGQTRNAYVAPATYKSGTKGRKEADARRISAVWQDFDVGEGKPFKTKEEAREAAYSLPVKPNIVVDSGGGIQMWWLLAQPIEGEAFERALRLIRGMQIWGGDPNVALKTQVMRVPGTFNHKYSKLIPVQLLSLDTSYTYTLNDFTTAGVPEIATKREQNAARVDSKAISIDGLVIDLNADPPQEKFERLFSLELFRKTWNHQRDDWEDPNDQSRVESSIGTTALNAGWSDQEVVNLWAANRREFAPESLQKLLRVDYLEQTLALCKTQNVECTHAPIADAPEDADLNYWRERALKAEARLAETAGPCPDCARKDALNLALQDKAHRQGETLTKVYRERQQVRKTVRHPAMKPLQKLALIDLAYEHGIAAQSERGLNLHKRRRVTHEGGDQSLARFLNCSGRTARKVTMALAAVGVIDRVEIPPKKASMKNPHSIVEIGMPYIEPWENLKYANSLTYEVKERKPGSGIRKPAPLACPVCPDADLLKQTTCECANCGRVVYATLKKRYPSGALVVSESGAIVENPELTGGKNFRVGSTDNLDGKNFRQYDTEDGCIECGGIKDAYFTEDAVLYCGAHGPRVLEAVGGVP
jgi:hypothetical protein